MKNFRTTIYSFLVMLAALSAPLIAHHGTAAFDTKKTVTVNGKITEFVYKNPHVQVYFEVKNAKGEMEKWQAELTAPNKLSRAGWNKATLKPGDSVKVTGFQVESGEHTIWIRELIGPDGTALQLFED